MDFVTKKPAEKKRKTPEKAKPPPKPKLADTAFRDLLQQTKARFENAFKMFPLLEGDIEKKKNDLGDQIVKLELAQKSKPKEEQKKECSVWTFMQDRLKQKKNEDDDDYKDRVKATNDFYKEFIEKFIFDTDGSGRICQWIKKNNIVNLLILETVGGALKDDGTPANDLQQDRWEGLLQLALGKCILQCIYCDDVMKDNIAKMCALAEKDPDNENKKASYFRRIYTEIAKSSFFGEKKAATAAASTTKKETNGHAKKKAKKSHSDDDEEEKESDDDDDDEEEGFEDDDDEEADEDDEEDYEDEENEDDDESVHIVAAEEEHHAKDDDDHGTGTKIEEENPPTLVVVETSVTTTIEPEKEKQEDAVVVVVTEEKKAEVVLETPVATAMQEDKPLEQPTEKV